MRRVGMTETNAEKTKKRSQSVKAKPCKAETGVNTSDKTNKKDGDSECKRKK